MRASHHGRFLWFDFMATDPAAAIEFYTTVVGWKTEIFGDGQGPDGPYRMLVGAEGPIGGVMGLPEQARASGVPPHWIGYIGVEDIAASSAQATALGAQIMHSFTMPTVGQIAIGVDPFGAAFALFQPESPSEHGAFAPAMGEVSWHELMTTDPDKALAFYGALFGWVKTTAMDMGEMGTYQMYGPTPETSYGGMMKAPEGMPNAWMYYTRVPDIEAAAAAIPTHGGAVMHGPMQVPTGGHVVLATDPQGGAFALHQSAD